jgi:hypothetical protein
MDAADFPRLGFAESLERLQAMPEFLDAALVAAQPEDLLARPGPEEFSLVEHACHLGDLEREGYLARVRRMLSETCPDLEPFDGAAVAAARDYPSQDARAAAHDFAVSRREVIALLQPLTADDLRREGTFAGRRICFADLVAMMVEHDRGHREEIERLMDAIED